MTFESGSKVGHNVKMNLSDLQRDIYKIGFRLQQTPQGTKLVKTMQCQQTFLSIHSPGVKQMARKLMGTQGLKCQVSELDTDGTFLDKGNRGRFFTFEAGVNVIHSCACCNCGEMDTGCKIA